MNMEQEVIKAATGVATTAANKGIGKLTDLVFSKQIRQQRRLDHLSSVQDQKDAAFIQKGLAEFRDGKFILIEDQIGNPTSPLGLILSQNHHNQSENLGKCLNKTYEHLSEKTDEEISDEQISETFFNKWMNYGKEVSENELQDLWGSILAKEISEPNSINYLVLNTLSLMSKRHLEAFHDLLPFICQTCLFCIPSQDFHTNYPFMDPQIIDELMDLNIIKSIYPSDIFTVTFDLQDSESNGLHSCLKLNQSNLLCFKTVDDQPIKPTFFGLSTIASKLHQIALSKIPIQDYCSKLIANLMKMPSFSNVTSIALYQKNELNELVLKQTWDI
ncbi:DUF2806 domain-containing protein [Acinetobacter sp. SM34]|uniref:DUF2806 domain-containing protein n=1 Tax=Acinetobacter sp. SM34 TaxID=1301620 RepID=UPI001EDB8022|nr:DUF2806 domain-containing protein [Acinetobacter sp. SM34]MCG2608016.1 DUF2806 domain-containing protein [Acinetobacter sp. SM34]